MKLAFSAQTIWQVIEKVFRVSSLGATSILITNQLGVEAFGNYSFIVNNFLIALAFANFGTANYVSSEAASRKVNDSEVLGTFFIFRLLTSCVSLIFVYITYLYMDYEIDILFLFFIFAISLSSLDVLENYNIGKGRYSLNLQIKVLVLLIGLIIRMYCYYNNYDWSIYLFIFFSEYMLAYVLISCETIRKLSVQFTFNWTYLNNNLNNIVALSATSVLALLTVRIDQYLLKFMLGLEELGTYNFLFGFINVSTFLPLVVFYVKLPVLAQTRELSRGHQKEHVIALRLFFVSGFVGSVVSLLLSTLVMYHYNFDKVYWVVIFTLSFLPLLTASSLYQVILIMVYDYKWLGLLKVMLSAAIVIILGPILVQAIGVTGVALSLIISLISVEIFFIIKIDEKLRTTYVRMMEVK